ncbi:MAG: exopolysaccharide Pel transporter PelG, partial [Candidatus Lindowbacteria bacterium]|nr:exopolysaccharide Pel transporter PelG [Candidatus Lindowbacteria bacterium]
VSLGALGIFQTKAVSLEESHVFSATVVYIFAFSLLVVGIIQMPLTRYLADLLFTKDLEMYLPTYIASLIVVGMTQVVIGFPFCFIISKWTFIYSLHTLILYLCISFIWIAMLFLSTAKDYLSITAAFVIGGTTSVALGFWCGKMWGSDGYMIGFTIGQVLIFLILSARIALEFPSLLPLNFDFMRYVKMYPSLIAIGFIYSLGIWLDKFVFWFNITGNKMGHFLFTSQIYDTPMFLAYLTVVPAMSLFLIRIETSFYYFYKDYYGAIVGKKSLDAIRDAKKKMVGSIKLSIERLIKIQGIFSFVCLLMAPYLIEPLSLDWTQLNILRVGIIAAFLHVMMLLLSVCLLYFEFRTEALILMTLFAVLNAVGSQLSIYMGAPYYGYGYLLATMISLFAGIVMLDYKVKKLEYITFVQQPMVTN